MCGAVYHLTEARVIHYIYIYHLTEARVIHYIYVYTI